MIRHWKKYNEFYSIETTKGSEKLPNKIKLSLERGKDIEINWNNHKLNSLINDCVNIENNIKNIKILNERIIKSNYSNTEMKFFPSKEGVNNLLNSIKNFGLIKKIISKFETKIAFWRKISLYVVK